MATKKSNNRMNNTQSTTKVLCSACGAEIIIPANQHPVSEMAIGKDSGLGTVVLPTTGGGAECMAYGCTSRVPNAPTSATSIEAVLASALNSPNAARLLAGIIDKIESEGYIEVEGIVRRWIPSQCLQMLYSTGYRGEEIGFHKMLKRKGYDYGWDVLLADLKKQAKMFAESDMEGYNDRNRWYNKSVALDMANNYLLALKEHIKNMPERNHKKRKYVKLRCNWMNQGKGIHSDELLGFYAKLETAIRRISLTKNPKTLLAAVQDFNKLRSGIWFNPELCNSFMNAYKAAGAYYTIKDLILFEGCLMQVNAAGDTCIRRYNEKRHFIKQEEPLAALERKTTELVGRGINEYGYEMLGLLKEFLKYNNFNFEATKQEWAKQSEARKLMREINKSRRPRK